MYIKQGEEDGEGMGCLWVIGCKACLFVSSFVQAMCRHRIIQHCTDIIGVLEHIAYLYQNLRHDSHYGYVRRVTM